MTNKLIISDNLIALQKMEAESIDCVYHVYIHQNIANLKIYVGYSKQPKRRWCLTKNAAFNPNDPQYNEPMYRAIRRDGWDSFTHQIIETFDNKTEALEAEKFWIEFFRSNRNKYGAAYGYNLHEGGNCPPNHKGRKKSEEHKRKISEAHIGKKHDEKWNYNHGKSVETPLTDVQLMVIKNSTLSYKVLQQTYHISNRRIHRIKNDK